MAARIAVHVRTRGTDFRTIEEPLDLPRALDARAAAGDADVVLVDCLTLWLSNLLLRGDSEERIGAQVDALVAALARRRFHVLLVTNEVGLGIVPESALARLFRDVAGRAHQQLASVADEIYFAVLGTILRLRPEPLAVTVPARDADSPMKEAHP
jgi:adenosylcobinamide kinase / adenosylcobinamide-phosphate guanylyltransferase